MVARALMGTASPVAVSVVVRQPNERLKLTAPGVQGTIPFVFTQPRRRSLGAAR
jgi:hypothetical protein